MEDFQAEVPCQHIEVAIVVQDFMVMHQAVGADQHVHGLSHGDTAATEPPVVGGRLDRDVTTRHLQEREGLEQVERPLLISGEGGRLEYPLTVVYTGTPAAQRALELALRLVRLEPSQLRIAVWDGGDVSRDVDELEAEALRLATSYLEGGPARLTLVKVVIAA